MKEIQLNRPSARTFRWLHMNETTLPAPELSSLRLPEENAPAGLERGAFSPLGLATGAGSELAALLPEGGRGYRAAAGKTIEEPLRLACHWKNGEASRLSFELEENARLTVILDHDSEEAGSAAVQLLANLKEGALLRLVQIQRTGESFTFFSDLGGVCAADARIELIRLVLAGRDTYDGCRIDLRGDRSSLDVGIGYLVSGEGRLDMNYEAAHSGRKTQSDIYASGVLRDRAHKLFRGTIDLRQGCAGAVGNENEDVLLMDPTVRNQTVPNILCTEEDVVGNHGCTIGRLDEGLIFYLQSRGMSREEIYELMARARVDAIIHRIPDEETRARLSGEAQT